ncbi:cytochrome P450 [Scleroderma citrinum]
MTSSATWLGVCLASAAAYFIQRIVFKRSTPPLPPGPEPLPILGNLYDLPTEKPCITYTEWSKKFGDIVHIHVFGQHIILINSAKTAVEMLDKKSVKYSDRPVLPLAGDLLGCKRSLPLLSYGDTFRETRKRFHRTIGTRAAVEEYSDIETIEIHRFLKRVLAKPEQLVAHIRLTIGAVVLRIAYGYQVKEGSDHLVNLAEEAVGIFLKATAPGAFLVDSIPICKYTLGMLYAWELTFPCSEAREWKAVMDELVDVPYNLVKSQVEAGVAPKSYTSVLLEGRVASLSEEEVLSIKWSAASFYGGGADTASEIMSVAAMHSMFLAMTLFPEVQKKAQAEIDAIVGLDRLPTLSDRQSLPYMEALVKEIHRWHVVSPLGVPHRTSEDDVHNGYYIPKGTIILANLWSMLHDPHSFSAPMEFRPERFLMIEGKQPEQDPRTICFGFGRRICPGGCIFLELRPITILSVTLGLQLADASVWLLTAMTLAVFDIKKAVEGGVEITPDVDPSSQGVRDVPKLTHSILIATQNLSNAPSNLDLQRL